LGFYAAQCRGQNNFTKIEEAADNFENIIQKFRVSDLVDDEELKGNLNKFLAYLKKNNPKKFINCNKALLKTTLKSMPTSIDEERVNELKKFFFRVKIRGLLSGAVERGCKRREV